VPLAEQLREGGMMVIPVGERYQQTLYLMKKKDGKLEPAELRPTLFVPMTGAAEDTRRVKPDPLNPRIINGGFEEEVGENGFIPGWYYQRQHEWETDKLAPQGDHFVTFRNEDEGRDAHIMQGFAIDGTAVRKLRLSGSVKHDNVHAGLSRSELPVIAVSFYDADRKDLGYQIVGPFRGSQAWHEVEKTMRVPLLARECIIRIGLFGATGEVSFDNLDLVKIVD